MNKKKKLKGLVWSKINLKNKFVDFIGCHIIQVFSLFPLSFRPSKSGNFETFLFLGTDFFGVLRSWGIIVATAHKMISIRKMTNALMKRPCCRRFCIAARSALFSPKFHESWDFY